MIAEDGPDIVLERIVIEAEQADAARWRTRTLMLCRIFRVLSPAQRVQLRGMVGERLVASAHVD